MLQLADISLSYDRTAGRGPGHAAPVLDHLSLEIGRRDFVSVLGRSGAGKTTLLNIAAGFLSPSGGAVSVDGVPIRGPGADRAVVFQDDALFSWLSARDNVALPLKLKGVDVKRRRSRADELLRLVGLADHAGKSVWELSGGQRQRIGIARALAADPKFLLMDEPLGALDAMTRERMQELLLKVWSRSRSGVLLITHSVEEAIFLGTRVVVLAPGRGRIVFDRRIDFAARFLAGETARSLKAEPGFIALREEVIAAIGEDDGQLS